MLDGILTHSLDRELLARVSKNFERIGCVPSGYHYPELFAGAADPVRDIVAIGKGQVE